MRTQLRLAAFFLALAVSFFWLVSGRNLGFTQTSIVQKRSDPVTQIEVNDYVPGFVPGADFLGAGLLVAVALAGGSFFTRNKFAGQNKTENTGSLWNNPSD